MLGDLLGGPSQGRRDLLLADPVNQLHDQHGVVAERLFHRLGDLTLPEQAEFEGKG